MYQKSTVTYIIMNTSYGIYYNPIYNTYILLIFGLTSIAASLIGLILHVTK